MADDNPLVQVTGLFKSFGDTPALTDVSLTINPGEVVALLGVNGAGKTTLINHLLGRLRPTAGEVRINGAKPGSLLARQSMGAILQATEMPGTLTVAEHLTLFSSYYPNPLSLENVLKIASLTDIANKRFDILSGGQKQRVFFAMAICGQPQIVLLDEPTVGLDVQSRRDFWACIRQLRQAGTAVLLTTHYLEEADALADRVLVLAGGRLLHEGTTASIKRMLGGKRIRFRTNATVDHVNKLLAGDRVSTCGEYTEVITSNEIDVLRVILGSELTLSDLLVEQVTLEDAFLHLSNQLASGASHVKFDVPAEAL